MMNAIKHESALIEHDIRLTYAIAAFTGSYRPTHNASLSQLLKNRRRNSFEYIFFYSSPVVHTHTLTRISVGQHVLNESAFIIFAGSY